MSFFKVRAVLVVLTLVCSLPISASEFTPELRETCLKTQFYVRPAWDDAIASLVRSLREQIHQAHQQGKTVVYISLPLTANTGGLREFNEYLGVLQRDRLVRQNSLLPMEIILPGQAEVRLPQIEGLSPQGGEYLYMWTQVLAGEDCTGDIDWVYFMHFTDVHSMLNLHSLSDTRKVTEFERLLKQLVKYRPEVYSETYSSPRLRKSFISYYLYHYSVMDSKGARDEWNMIQLLGRQQPARAHIRQGFMDQWSRDIQPMVKPGYQQNMPQPTSTHSRVKSDTVEL